MAELTVKKQEKDRTQLAVEKEGKKGGKMKPGCFSLARKNATKTPN